MQKKLLFTIDKQHVSNFQLQAVELSVLNR